MECPNWGYSEQAIQLHRVISEIYQDSIARFHHNNTAIKKRNDRFNNKAAVLCFVLAILYFQGGGGGVRVFCYIDSALGPNTY